MNDQVGVIKDNNYKHIFNAHIKACLIVKILIYLSIDYRKNRNVNMLLLSHE